MKWPWIMLIVGAVTIFCFFMLTPREDECNFCSGSGQGADCPRHDAQARKECLDSVHDHYCGPHPENCG